MFGWKKKGPQATFKQRVAEFWQWYPTVAERFFETIERGECESLADEVSEFMDQALPDMSWVFGPGENGGHSFTLSGEGHKPKQLLAEYWRSQAPELPHWTFHASRQPTTPEQLKNIAIAVGDGDQVDAESFLLKTAVDEEAQLIHLTAWHPALAELPEEHHYQILFLLLDEALGEFGVQTWLGELKIEPFEAGEATQTIATLPAFIDQVEQYHQWEKLPPLQSYALYEAPEQHDFPRGDTVVGTTCIADLVFDLLENGGRLAEDPLPGLGAEFAYVAIDGSVFPDGQQSDVRGNIEDALSDALQSEQAGRTLGGAFGAGHSYIDLLLLDGENSRRIVELTLDKLQLRGKAELRTFV